MDIYKAISGMLIYMLFGVVGASAIDQRICLPGSSVELHPNGALKTCVLSDSFKANNITCKSLHPVSFYDNGLLDTCVLAEPATISLQKCKDGPVSFYSDGKFRSCVKED